MNENFATKTKTAKPYPSSAMAEDAFEKTKTAAEQGRKVLQEAFANAGKGAADFNLKLIDIVHANTEAAFDFARQVVAVKSPAEFLELSAGHARKQFEAFTEQTKELTTLAQKMATDAGASVQHGASKVFNTAA